MPGSVWEKAVELATDQYGFITYTDLRELGEDPVRLRQWVQRGGVERVGHGIYRFQQIPPTPLDPYMLATLWPAGRGVLSHETALELHELRHRVVSENIANAETPGYRARRVDFEDELREAFSEASPSRSGVEARAEIDRRAPLKADRNSVDLDLEMARLSENTLRTVALSRLLARKYASLKAAIAGAR